MESNTKSSSSVKFLNITSYYAGISDSRKLGPTGSFQFGQSINFRDEGTEFHLQPKPVKVSDTTVTDNIKWICDGSPYDTNRYFYGSSGNIYQEDVNGVWSVLGTVANSHGQGFEVYADYLYYAQDTQVGRYGPLDGSPTFTDNWATGYQNTAAIGWAPIKAFVGGMAIGNGNYLSWFDGSVIPTNGTAAQITALTQLEFNPGENVRCLEVIDEYLAIGTQRGNDITLNDTGYVFYWDGSSTTFNFFASTENGGCNAVGNSNNRLFSVLGSSSKLFINYRPFQPIQRIPKLKTKNYCEVWPGAITTWQNLVYFGLAANSDSTDIYKGSYSWGRTSSLYPESLSYDFPISTGNTGSTVKVTALKGLGNYLYVAWQDGSNYGVDKITANGSVNPSGFYESLVFGEFSRNNQALTIKCTHYPLAAGESVQVGYRLDRFSDYYFPEAANTTIGSQETRLPVEPANSIYYELEFKIILTGTSTTPTIIYTGVKFDDLPYSLNDW
jgi:hypothetical protein